MRAQTQMVAELRADNTALRSELAELHRAAQRLAAGGAGASGHRAVAGPAGAHEQSGPPGCVAAPACLPAPPPQPTFGMPAVNRAVAPSPPPTIPTVEPGDGRAYARGEKMRA